MDVSEIRDRLERDGYAVAHMHKAHQLHRLGRQVRRTVPGADYDLFDLSTRRPSYGRAAINTENFDAEVLAAGTSAVFVISSRLTFESAIDRIVAGEVIPYMRTTNLSNPPGLVEGSTLAS